MSLSWKKTLLILLGILFLAGLIRIFKLGQVPGGLTWDEAAIGYNGYAILTTRRDEWLTKLPVSFKSFGDFKAPLAIYLSGPFIYFFGANSTALRLPFAISGVMAVLGTFILNFLIFKESPDKRRFIALFSAFIIALSPWHIFFSRVGFESGLALNFVIWSVVLFYFSLKKIRNQKTALLSIIFSVILAVMSLYTYHSAKIFVPLLALLLISLNFSKVRSKLRNFLIAGLIGVILLYPLIKDAIYGQGLERAGVTIFNQNLGAIETLKLFLWQFSSHFHPNFLIFGETSNLRHGDGNWGVIFPTTLFLLIFLIILLLTKFKNKDKIPTHFWLYFGWTIIGIIPSAISTEAPHSNRSLMALPGLIGLSSISLLWMIDWLNSIKSEYFLKNSKNNSKLLAPSILGTFFCIHLLLFTGFISDYFFKYSQISTDAYQEGYLEAVKIARDYQKGQNGRPKTHQVIFSKEYGQPYIFILFANKINPIAYQGGILQPYLFLDKITIDDLNRSDTLLVATKYSDLPLESSSHIIYGSDGSVRFKIYYLPPKDDSQIIN